MYIYDLLAKASTFIQKYLYVWFSSHLTLGVYMELRNLYSKSIVKRLPIVIDTQLKLP